MSAGSEQKEIEVYRVIFDVDASAECHVLTWHDDNGALYYRYLLTSSSPLDKDLFVQAMFNDSTDPNFHCLVNTFGIGLYRVYSVIFDVDAYAECHVLTRHDDNGASYRRYFLTSSSPLDKRLFVRAMFNGPDDPNFHCLVNTCVT